MLHSHERPIFLAACASNLVFAIVGGFALEMRTPLGDAIALIGGAAAFALASFLGIRILTHGGGLHRKWVKAGLVFLLLGPLAFWGLQQPAMAQTMCSAQGCAIDAAHYARAVGDVIQSQAAMIVVALAALACAARAMFVTLDELAV